jgi:nicotinamide-nucleotide amidase
MNVNHVLVERLAGELNQRGFHITVAESCTGGWIAKHLTDFPGSSQWFEYGFVSYGNNAKAGLLNVDPALIAQHGAVSSEVSAAMVTGALDRSGADIGLAVTGIAGPEGGTAEKPVGTVWLAWAQRGGAPHSECHLLEGDRDTIRRQAVSTALQQVLKFLEQKNV